MARFASFSVMTVLAGWLLASPSQAQTRRVINPYNYVLVSRPSPYWGYNRYPLDALAEYTRAEGEYMIMRQQAIQEREKSTRMKLETHEMIVKQWWKMREFSQEMQEKDRDRILKAELDHSRDHASVPEIVSGNVLNYLLRELSRESLPVATSPKIEQAWLDHINFTSTGGNAYLLRKKTIPWTAVLQEDDFKPARDLLEATLEEARAEVQADKVPGKTLKELIRIKENLNDGLSRMNQGDRKGWGDRQFIEARRQMYELAQTLKLLENPEEAKFLLGFKPTAGTVAELVAQMREKAVQFAPASTTGVRHYISLHTAFATEARALQKRRGANK